MTATTQKRNWKMRLSTVCLAALIAPLASGTPAGANDACGEFSYGFSGTRLLNDGISGTAGPFAAELPAGTYTVTLISHDNHSTQLDAESQTGEQFQVVLDSGYVSAPSTDIPDDADTTSTVFEGQEIEAATTISVKHAGAPGINSVDVVCVGFTPDQPAEATEPSEVVEPIDAAEQADTPPTDDGVEFLDEDVVPVVEPEPTSDIGEPASVTRPANDEPPPLEVEGITDGPALVEPAPEVLGVQVINDNNVPLLAITGPSNRAITLVATGFVLITLGAMLVRRERRFS